MTPQTSPSNNNLLIELDNVSKRYGEKWAVRDLSLQIKSGELFAFLGRNGAGKTTTIKMIIGLLRPTMGNVVVAGHNMLENSEIARQHISYVPDQPFIYEKLTGRDFLEFVRKIYGLSGAEIREYEEHLIRMFEMTDYVDDLTESYSHGMRQRLAFAAAMLHRPRVLVVDEPMVGLDPKSMRIVKDLLRRTAKEGTAVFMSTHTLAIAEEIADRIGIIHHGQLVRIGTLEELKKEIKHDVSLEEFFLGVTEEHGS